MTVIQHFLISDDRDGFVEHHSGVLWVSSFGCIWCFFLLIGLDCRFGKRRPQKFPYHHILLRGTWYQCNLTLVILTLVSVKASGSCQAFLHCEVALFALPYSILYFTFFFFYFFLFYCHFRATHMTYGSSRSRSQIRAATVRLGSQQCQIWATSVTYTTASGNAESLTHWVRPGVEPASSWILVGFLTCWARVGTPRLCSFEAGH